MHTAGAIRGYNTGRTETIILRMSRPFLKFLENENTHQSPQQRDLPKLLETYLKFYRTRKTFAELKTNRKSACERRNREVKERERGN
jgi:hypothetical protein